MYQLIQQSYPIISNTSSIYYVKRNLFTYRYMLTLIPNCFYQNITFPVEKSNTVGKILISTLNEKFSTCIQSKVYYKNYGINYEAF